MLKTLRTMGDSNTKPESTSVSSGNQQKLGSGEAGMPIEFSICLDLLASSEY